MKRKRQKSEARSGAGPQLAIIAGVLLLIVAVLVFKKSGSKEEAAGSQDAVPVIPTAADVEARSQPAPAVAVAETPAAATEQAGPNSAASGSPEAQLDHHLEAGRPILAFFHSNTCVQCVRMTEIVDEVYPDFSNEIALVDVNVYDQKNENLLRRARIQVIPTVILINRAQQAKGYQGVMAADALRAELETLAQEP